MMNHLLLLLLLYNPVDEHAIYLSLTEISIDNGGKGTINIKLFSDDLQDALRNHDSRYELASLNDYFRLNKEIGVDYLNEQLQLTVNGSEIPMNYSGCTIENEAHFIRFTFTVPEHTNSLNIKASYLLELFPTQTNVIKVQARDKEQYLRLSDLKFHTVTFD